MPPNPSPSRKLKKLYVVAVNRKEAVELALIIGHRKKSDANAHLAEVKAPPTDPHYANQYRVYCIPIESELPNSAALVDVRTKLRLILAQYSEYEDSAIISSIVTIDGRTVRGKYAKPADLTIGELRRLCDVPR